MVENNTSNKLNSHMIRLTQPGLEPGPQRERPVLSPLGQPWHPILRTSLGVRNLASFWILLHGAIKKVFVHHAGLSCPICTIRYVGPIFVKLRSGKERKKLHCNSLFFVSGRDLLKGKTNELWSAKNSRNQIGSTNSTVLLEIDI